MNNKNKTIERIIALADSTGLARTDSRWLVRCYEATINLCGSATYYFTIERMWHNGEVEKNPSR